MAPLDEDDVTVASNAAADEDRLFDDHEEQEDYVAAALYAN